MALTSCFPLLSPRDWFLVHRPQTKSKLIVRMRINQLPSQLYPGINDVTLSNGRGSQVISGESELDTEVLSIIDSFVLH